jgi:DNA/RNA-binding domain of Phe-tRNA-synthetase-like protein
MYKALRSIEWIIIRGRPGDSMLRFNIQLAKKIPSVKVAVANVLVAKVENTKDELEELKKSVTEEVRSKYCLETVKDVRLFRCYRDFYWRLGIDPTKVRPASEALIRRILQGGSIPTINTVVDAINIASIRTQIVIDAIDVNKIAGKLEIRFSSKGEKFLGIGMKHEVELRGDEIVISDNNGAIALYPHRDSERTRVTDQTIEVLTVSCGVPGIEDKELLAAGREVSSLIIRFCGGKETGGICLLPS